MAAPPASPSLTSDLPEEEREHKGTIDKVSHHHVLDVKWFIVSHVVSSIILSV